jgi:hypothetical protein
LLGEDRGGTRLQESGVLLHHYRSPDGNDVHEGVDDGAALKDGVVEGNGGDVACARAGLVGGESCRARG